ncbi:class I SAM-dependent methyltransferase [Roseateles sp.]|uniref:class I SAM-dependent methyltransferase n=1 Tax=Roseateles sp. TaxID=1971397 RepID=UPI00326465F3
MAQLKTNLSSPRDAPADATARFYDGAAADYDAQVDDQGDNAAVRLSFCERVASLAGPGGAILDFGCGTGTDAAWYAARGHRVIAYDVSPGMVNLLRARCRNEIAAGRITPAVGPLDAMETALETSSPVATISANFAVLSHVPELKPLLQLLASHVKPGGALVASVLNPFYRQEMRQRWWWRSALRSIRTGSIKLQGQVTSYRHFVSTIRKAAEPHFTLTELHAASENTLLGALDSHFLFVVLRRRP